MRTISISETCVWGWLQATIGSFDYKGFGRVGGIGSLVIIIRRSDWCTVFYMDFCRWKMHPKHQEMGSLWEDTRLAMKISMWKVETTSFSTMRILNLIFIHIFGKKFDYKGSRCFLLLFLSFCFVFSLITLSIIFNYSK